MLHKKLLNLNNFFKFNNLNIFKIIKYYYLYK